MSGNRCPKLEMYDKSKSSVIRVFVLMPFKDTFFDNYKFAITEVFSSAKNYECKNAGESIFIRSEYIICKICEEIFKSNLVIADLTEPNLNVYYELGLAHAIGINTILIANETHKKTINENFKRYLGHSNVNIIPYSNIKELENSLMLRRDLIKEGFGNEGNCPSQPDNPDDNNSVICIVPTDKDPDKFYSVNNEMKIKFNEVLDFGIKKSIKQLTFPGEDMITIDKDTIFDILRDGQDGCRDKQKIEVEIKKARYCIIDTTAGSACPEVFYWLGFTHGWGVKKKEQANGGGNDNSCINNTSCLYITQDDIENLPFDVKPSRFLKYSSIKHLSKIIREELERLEVTRLHEINEEKNQFWGNFDLKNTRFILGAIPNVYSEPPEPSGIQNTRIYSRKDRINVRHFRVFNRIVYLLLFIGESKAFQYDMKVLNVADFFVVESGAKEQELLEILFNEQQQPNGKSKTKSQVKIGFEKITLENIKLEFNNKLFRNYIILGSSSINVVVELIMFLLYGNNEVTSYKGYYFITKHIYKTPSMFWNPDIKNIAKKSGILMPPLVLPSDKNQNSEHGYCQVNLDDKGKGKQDLGFLVITNNLEINRPAFVHRKLLNGEKYTANGQFVVMSGFSNDGVYILGRLLSKYENKKSSSQESTFYCRQHEENTRDEGSEDTEIYSIDNFFKIVNKTIAAANNISGNYCIEAVFQFENVNTNAPENAEKYLIRFANYNREDGTRQDIMNDLKTIRRDQPLGG